MNNSKLLLTGLLLTLALPLEARGSTQVYADGVRLTARIVANGRYAFLQAVADNDNARRVVAYYSYTVRILKRGVWVEVTLRNKSFDLAPSQQGKVNTHPLNALYAEAQFVRIEIQRVERIGN